MRAADVGGRCMQQIIPNSCPVIRFPPQTTGHPLWSIQEPFATGKPFGELLSVYVETLSIGLCLAVFLSGDRIRSVHTVDEKKVKTGVNPYYRFMPTFADGGPVTATDRSSLAHTYSASEI